MFDTNPHRSFLTADATHIAPPIERRAGLSLSDRIKAHAKIIGITSPRPLILQGAS